MKEIATALVKAQMGFSPALKSANNPFFKSKYADLGACVDAVLESLNSNGIALVQNCHESADGVIVETVFVHESGEILSTGKLHVPAGKHDAQGYGSALTYARRYSLMAACGIAPEDDDGNAAAKTTEKKSKTNPAKNVLGKKPYSIGDGITISKEREGELEGVIAKTLKWCADERWADALLEMDNNAQDNEEKLFMWSFLDSAQRSAVTKEVAAQKAKYLKQEQGTQA
jgi:hypothetical protein